MSISTLLFCSHTTQPFPYHTFVSASFSNFQPNQSGRGDPAPTVPAPLSPFCTAPQFAHRLPSTQHFLFTVHHSSLTVYRSLITDYHSSISALLPAVPAFHFPSVHRPITSHQSSNSHFEMCNTRRIGELLIIPS
mgnify:CR=1 FL=1